ncbi:AAA family ATPase [Streptomyces sp. NPDC050636]|uniref:ATP-binding protein n=1 Tax=Streptomyces sp. NPDC050636 TaxID=3154510 RepID=UPI003449D846
MIEHITEADREMSADPSGLVERAVEFADLASLVEEASGGGEALALIEGPAGVGKSTLLAVVTRHASRRGLTVLQASCCGLEQGLSFGVVRQLLEPALDAAGPGERASLLAGAAGIARAVFEQQTEDTQSGTDPLDVPFSQLHGLYLVAVRMAERAPLLLLVDDAHRADLRSRQWLTYLARRLRGSRVSLAVAVRTGESAADDALTAQLAAHPGCRRLWPGPLSPTSAAQCIGTAVGAEPGPEVAELYGLATGGNPYLLRALADDLARSGVPPTGPELPRVAALTARSLVHHLPVLLRRHSPAVPSVAATVAVLESISSMALLREVTGLDDVAVAGAVTVLEQAGLLEPGPPWRLRHPLLREALLAQADPDHRHELPARAAGALLALGGDEREVAGLLLATEPEGQQWRVRVLREAAQQALDRHDMHNAGAYLRRALREPPAETDRAAILAQLGIAEVHTDPAVAAEHLRTAVDEEPEPARRAQLVPHLAEALTRTGRAEEAIGLLDALADEIPEADRESLYRLWAQGILLLLEETPRLADVWINQGGIGDDLPGDTPGQRLLMAALALKNTLTGQCARTTATLAERALARFGPPADPVLTGAFGIIALLHADRLDEAAGWYQRVVGTALEGQPPPLRSWLLSIRTEVAYRLGDPRTALGYSRQALDLAPADQRYRPFSTSQAVHALLDLGDVAEAARVCRGPFEGPVGRHWSWTPLFAARARLRLAQGQPRAALADLEECGSRQMAGGYDNPALVPWRSEAALVHRHLGDRATATRLAREELELARAWGSPRTVAASLRGLGLLRTGPAAIDSLAEAVTLLESIPARVDLAHALTDLGEALHKDGHVKESRARLRQALDLADTSGAAPLTERVYRALLATGARPRRKRLSGVSALTSRECRIATLAAEGMTNQQIASTLFITCRTVEFHLTRAFRKLDINGRGDLARVLGGMEPTGLEQPTGMSHR